MKQAYQGTYGELNESFFRVLSRQEVQDFEEWADEIYHQRHEEEHKKRWVCYHPIIRIRWEEIDRGETVIKSDKPE